MIKLITSLIASLIFIGSVSFITKVSGNSMNPTYKDKDTLLINKLAYGIQLPRFTIANKTYSPFNFIRNNQYLTVFKNSEYGDVVIAIAPNGESIIKRIVAKQDDILFVKENILYISYSEKNMSLQEEYSDFEKVIINDISFIKAPYQHFLSDRVSNDKQYNNLLPIRIEKGYVFLMGDNRDFSTDSRDYGQVSIFNIIGKVSHFN